MTWWKARLHLAFLSYCTIWQVNWCLFQVQQLAWKDIFRLCAQLTELCLPISASVSSVYVRSFVRVCMCIRVLVVWLCESLCVCVCVWGGGGYGWGAFFILSFTQIDSFQREKCWKEQRHLNLARSYNRIYDSINAVWKPRAHYFFFIQSESFFKIYRILSWRMYEYCIFYFILRAYAHYFSIWPPSPSSNFLKLYTAPADMCILLSVLFDKVKNDWTDINLNRLSKLRITFAVCCLNSYGS